MSDEVRKLRPLMGTIALLSVLLLGWFHADLWFGQGGGDESSYRLGLMALLSDGAKVALFSSGVYLVLSVDAWAVKGLGGLAVAVSLALVVLSVTGVFGALSVGGARVIDAAQPDQTRLTELTSLANSYAAQVKSLQASKDLLPADWYTKRAEVDAQIVTAQAGYQKALTDKAAIPTKTPAEAAFFVGVATVTGWTADQARLRIYGAYAALLELVSLLTTLLALFGTRLADAKTPRLAKPAKPAKNQPETSPALAGIVAKSDAKASPPQELTKHARARQVMESYLAAAYTGIEAGQGDAFQGRNRIMAMSGLDRKELDWCVRQLTLKELIRTTTDPQRTVPMGTRAELVEKLFPPARGSVPGASGQALLVF
jgi:hypothetical protein